MTKPKNQDAEPLMQEVRAVIRGYAEALSKGEEVNIQGLDTLISQLSGFVLALPKEQAAAMQAPLEELVKELDALESELKRQRDQVANQLADIDKKRKASAAYSRSDTLTPKPKSAKTQTKEESEP
ncbi:MAG: hypothetical protein J0L97_01965 [Alphaproteobacteria bacterium]|nr:hypothetical protein [Alphaproteobacteria bacterium]